jgi:hypothetical protein
MSPAAQMMAWYSIGSGACCEKFFTACGPWPPDRRRVQALDLCSSPTRVAGEPAELPLRVGDQAHTSPAAFEFDRAMTRAPMSNPYQLSVLLARLHRKKEPGL